ncbi:MAG: diacylglycerol kinase family protein [Saprospiraceae bacterium]
MNTTSKTPLSTSKRKIRFIINPFAGVGQKARFAESIPQLLDLQQFDYDVCYTEYPQHATQLAKQAVLEGCDIVAAVGGDGSINEVAKGLIGTTTILAIIPAGSGNGLAMHLGIGRKAERAIQLLNESVVMKIDTGIVNGKPFINLAGTGFDAWIAYKTKLNKVRGLWAYVKHSMLETFSYQMQDYEITIDGRTINRACLVVEVANAPMFGYNFVVAPLAKLNDGLLEVVLIKKAPKWRYVFSFWRFFNKSVHQSSLTERYTAKKVSIKKIKKDLSLHLDGEGFLVSHSLEFSINELSLHILIPPAYSEVV